MVSESRATQPGPSSWTFLTNHAHVLLCIARNGEVRLTEIAQLVGIGERAVHRIVGDLVDAGYVARKRRGRNNVYEVHLDRPMRHPLLRGRQVGDLLGPLTELAPPPDGDGVGSTPTPSRATRRR